MLGAIYKGLTGLGAFSQGLSNISNNVSNVNTPGYRGKDLVFKDLYFKEGNSGHGVATGGISINNSQGDFRETGVDTNAAVDGNGYFLVEKNGKVLYTRVGQFEFDEGHLRTVEDGRNVQGYDKDGNLVSIDINDFRVMPPEATSTIKLAGNISRDMEEVEVKEVEVVDNLGEKHLLNIIFKPLGAAGQYNVTVTTESGATIALDEVRFDGNGTPINNFNNFSFNMIRTNGLEQKITVDFGESGNTNQVTNFPTGNESSVNAVEIDGKEKGELISTKIEENGEIVASYSNGEEQVLFTIALADISNLTEMKQIDSSLFELQGSNEPFIGKASTYNYGIIKGGNLEMANVDITDQFTDLVIVQRGYQASSQVLVTANEMMDTLLKAVNGNR